MSTDTISPLRQRMIEDMNARKLCAGNRLKTTDFLNQDCVFVHDLESKLLGDPLKILFQQHRPIAAPLSPLTRRCLSALAGPHWART